MPTEPTPPIPGDEDLDLVEDVRRGRSAAFDELVRRHEARVVRLCARILSDADAALDAAQESFVKAWRALPGFQGDARFSTWLTRIAINQCRNELRRRRTVKHAQPLSLDVPVSSDGQETRRDGLVARTPDPYEAARGREVAAAVAAALEEIDEEAREVIVLRDAEDLSYEDIAEVVGVPVGTVRSRLHRARADVLRRLRPVLSDEPAAAPRPRDAGVRGAVTDRGDVAEQRA
jgi:RNA polymerase sigma-70 factor, ECF subfamily